MLNERLDAAGARRKALEEDHAAVDVVGYRIYLEEEPEAMVAMDEPRTRDACFAIIVRVKRGLGGAKANLCVAMSRECGLLYSATLDGPRDVGNIEIMPTVRVRRISAKRCDFRVACL